VGPDILTKPSRVTHVRTCPAAVVASRTLEAPAGRCRSTGRLTVGNKRDREHRLDAHDRGPRARAPVPDHPGRRNGPLPPRVDLLVHDQAVAARGSRPSRGPGTTRPLTRGSTSTIGSCFPRLRELTPLQVRPPSTRRSRRRRTRRPSSTPGATRSPASTSPRLSGVSPGDPRTTPTRTGPTSIRGPSAWPSSAASRSSRAPPRTPRWTRPSRSWSTSVTPSRSRPDTAGHDLSVTGLWQVRHRCRLLAPSGPGCEGAFELVELVEEGARLLSYAATATVLGVGERTVKRLVAAGVLTPVRIGGSSRVQVEQLDAYLERLTAQSLSPKGTSSC